MQDDAGTRGYYTKIRKSVLYQSCTNFVPICKKYRRDIKICIAQTNLKSTEKQVFVGCRRDI